MVGSNTSLDQLLQQLVLDLFVLFVGDLVEVMGHLELFELAADGPFAERLLLRSILDPFGDPDHTPDRGQWQRQDRGDQAHAVPASVGVEAACPGRVAKENGGSGPRTRSRTRGARSWLIPSAARRNRATSFRAIRNDIAAMDRAVAA